MHSHSTLVCSLEYGAVYARRTGVTEYFVARIFSRVRQYFLGYCVADQNILSLHTHGVFQWPLVLQIKPGIEPLWSAAAAGR